MLLGSQGQVCWSWAAQRLGAAMRGLLNGASCFSRPERVAATCCAGRSTGLRQQAKRSSVLGTSPTRDRTCSSSARLRVDGSPTGRVVHLGWER